MKRICTLFLIFSAALAWAQQSASTNAPRFDVGTIATGFYINDCLGFSYPIPDGWEVNSQALGTSPGVAKHETGGGLILLIIDRHTNRTFFNRMVVSASDATPLKFDTAEFVNRFVQAQTSGDQPTVRKILKKAYPVEFAGKPFFRSDFTDQHGDATLYKAFLSTKFRGYFLEWTMVAGSPEELDNAANSLQKLVFRQDQADSACVMGK